MEEIRFKTKLKFEEGKIYSLCLRGARTLQNDVSTTYVQFIPPDLEDEGTYTARVISQRQYTFKNLEIKDLNDIYPYKGQLLEWLMKNYEDFDIREIVTILKFQIVD